MRDASERAITIRSARPSDARFIGHLAGQAFGEYDPKATLTTARMLRESAAHTLVAERAEPLGFAIVQPQANGALALNAIAVTARERGRGVGRRLLQAVESYARARGLRRLTLNTAQANLAALDLFLRSGFVLTDRAATPYFGAQPACKLEKQLG